MACHQSTGQIHGTTRDRLPARHPLHLPAPIPRVSLLALLSLSLCFSRSLSSRLLPFFSLYSLRFLYTHTQLPLLLDNCVVHLRIHCAAGRPPCSPALATPLPPHQLHQLFYSSLAFSHSPATSFATAVILCEVITL